MVYLSKSRIVDICTARKNANMTCFYCDCRGKYCDQVKKKSIYYIDRPSDLLLRRDELIIKSSSLNEPG